MSLVTNWNEKVTTVNILEALIVLKATNENRDIGTVTLELSRHW